MLIPHVKLGHFIDAIKSIQGFGCYLMLMHTSLSLALNYQITSEY